MVRDRTCTVIVISSFGVAKVNFLSERTLSCIDSDNARDVLSCHRSGRMCERPTEPAESATAAYGRRPPHAYGPNFSELFRTFQIVDRKRGIEGPERAPAGIRVPVHAAMGREPV